MMHTPLPALIPGCRPTSFFWCSRNHHLPDNNMLSRSAFDIRYFCGVDGRRSRICDDCCFVYISFSSSLLVHPDLFRFMYVEPRMLVLINFMAHASASRSRKRRVRSLVYVTLLEVHPDQYRTVYVVPCYSCFL
jgi:hypothetical protein